MPAANKKQEKKSQNDKGPILLTGVYVFPNGDRYDGEYTQLEGGGLQRDGFGSHVTSDGLQYTGNWMDDKMNGKGKLCHPSGAIYEGEFVNNTFHGLGKYTWPNGSYYEGNFTNNKVEGHGTFTDVQGQTWYGQFTPKAASQLKFKLNL